MFGEVPIGMMFNAVSGAPSSCDAVVRLEIASCFVGNGEKKRSGHDEHRSNGEKSEGRTDEKKQKEKES